MAALANWLEGVCILICLLIVGLAFAAPHAATAAEPEVPGMPALIPLPKSVIWLDEKFELPGHVPVIVALDDMGQAEYAVRDLAKELARAGITLDVRQAPHETERRGALVLGIVEPSSWLMTQVDEEHRDLVDLPSEGYVLSVTREGIIVLGADERGLYWGVQTLRQLLLRSAEGAAFQGVVIRDWPDFSVRALHMFPSSSSRELHVPIIANLMAPLKLNTLVLQIDHSRFASRPELGTSASADPHLLQALAETARQHHIEIVPLVNLFGHNQWAFVGGANVNIAANPGAPWALNPLKPESFAFAEQILAETIELFQPSYVHIGHDEVRMGGDIPTGGRPFGQVFVDVVRHFYDFLAERGVGTMIWADEALKPDVVDYIDQLPKDIVMVYWSYTPQDTYPQIDTLKDKGFPVIVAAWDDPKNIEALARDGQRRNVDGFMGTTWAGFYPDITSLYQFSSQYVAYVLDAEFSWNTFGRALDTLPYNPADFVHRTFATAPDPVIERVFTVDLRSVATGNVAAALGTTWVERRVDGVNRARRTDELIVYTPLPGRPTTQTNEWGFEAVVGSDGRIVSAGGNDQPIPEGGFVLSGHGASRIWLAEHAQVGARVEFVGDEFVGDIVRIITDSYTKTYQEIAALPRGLQTLNGIPFDIIDPDENDGRDGIVLSSDRAGDTGMPGHVTIPIGKRATSLWLLQSATHRVAPMTHVGTYEVQYADGGRLVVPLIYGINIVAWHDPHRDLRNWLVWRGEEGRELTALLWVNPHPEKEISGLSFRSTHAGSAPVLIAVSGVEVP